MKIYIENNSTLFNRPIVLDKVCDGGGFGCDEMIAHIQRHSAPRNFYKPEDVQRKLKHNDDYSKLVQHYQL